MRDISLLSMLLAVACLLAIGVESSGNLEAILTRFDRGLDAIEWISPKVVFVLTTGGQVKISHDGGRSFAKIPSLEKPQITEVFYSPAEKNVMLFAGTESFFVTKNYGRTTHELQWVIEDVRYHEKKGNLLMGSRMSDGCKDHRTEDKCFKQLLYSDDYGHTWNHMLDYVVQYDFVPSAKVPKEHKKEDLIYATAHSNMNTDQPFGRWMKDVNLYESMDFFKTSEMVLQYGNRFSFGESNFMFVAAVDPDVESSEEVYLMVSKDYGFHFQEAVLPLDLSEHSYTIVDTSEGVVFLHVNHRPFGESAPSGHVYVSDWRGLVFSLSLPNNHRSGNGDCDFEKVYGLEGIYMANFLDSDGVEDIEEEEESFLAPKHGAGHHYREKTVISFDKGAQWSFLQPPELDSEGKKWECTDESNCHLHLNGITSNRGFFYSQETAVGLILGTGNVGAHLSKSVSEMGTFMSRDAGLTWYEIRKGSYIYEYGDHGGLLVLANDVDSTDTLLYSHDEGKTFKEFKMSQQPFTVENIVIEPTASAKEFIVYGYRNGEGIVVYISFAELHERQCHGETTPDTPHSDYEVWTPNDGRTGGRCIMGRSTTYLRRKQDAKCFNFHKLNHHVAQQHCQCTWNDYECDFGYERKSIAEGLLQGGMGWATEGGWNPPSLFASEPCVLTKEKHHNQEGYEVDRHGHLTPENSDLFILAETCKADVLKHRITKGYRRIAGDSCIGGEFWDATWEQCPGAWKHMAGGKMFVVALILVIVAAGCYVAVFKAHLLGLDYTPLDMLAGCIDYLSLCECASRLCDCLNRRPGSYHLVGQPGNVEDPFDDEGLDATGVAQG